MKSALFQIKIVSAMLFFATSIGFCGCLGERENNVPAAELGLWSSAESNGDSLAGRPRFMTNRGTLPDRGSLPYRGSLPNRGSLPTARGSLPTTRGSLPNNRSAFPSRGSLPQVPPRGSLPL